MAEVGAPVILSLGVAGYCSVRPTLQTAKRVLRACYIVMALASVSVRAHAPYERVAGNIGPVGGQQLTLVKCFTDGILFPDPVVLEVRDANGGVLAQTDLQGEIEVSCDGTSMCTVFGFASHVSPLFPGEVWSVTGAHLTPVPVTGLHYIHGAALHVRANWAPYAFLLVAALVPVLGAALWQRLPPGGLRIGLGVGLACAALVWYFFWFMALQFAYLSVGLLLAAAVVVSAGGRAAMRRVRVAPRGLTMQ